MTTPDHKNWDREGGRENAKLFEKLKISEKTEKNSQLAFLGYIAGNVPVDFHSALNIVKLWSWTKNFNTRRPASTGIFFAGIQIFWSTFAHS